MRLSYPAQKRAVRCVCGQGVSPCFPSDTPPSRRALPIFPTTAGPPASPPPTKPPNHQTTARRVRCGTAQALGYTGQTATGEQSSTQEAIDFSTTGVNFFPAGSKQKLWGLHSNGTPMARRPMQWHDQFTSSGHDRPHRAPPASLFLDQALRERLRPACGLEPATRARQARSDRRGGAPARVRGQEGLS